MSVSVSMPQLGESVTEGTVTRWLKKEGEHVEADEPLLEVSTDKVDTEIPSPASGILRSIAVDEDETVAVGAQLAVIEDSESADSAPEPSSPPAQDDTPAPQAAAPQPEAEPAPPAEPAQPEAGQGRHQRLERTAQLLPAARARRRAGPGLCAAARVRPAPVLRPARGPVAALRSAAPAPSQPYAQPAAQAPPAQAEAAPAAEEVVPAAHPAAGGRRGALRHPAGPQARRRARGEPGDRQRDRRRRADPQAGRHRRRPRPGPRPGAPGCARGRRVPARPAGSGRQQAPAAQQAPAGQPAQAGQSAAPAPRRPAVVPSSLRGTTQKMSRPRQVIAQRMVESLQTSAQLTTVVEVDVTAIARLRDRAKADFEAREGVKLTFLPFFALAAVEALKMHPKLNAVIDGDQVIYHDAEHLGIAVDTDRGLMVPVIHNAGDLNIGGLARKIGEIAQRTRSGQVSPDELSGGTFTLTNTGSRGALFDTPIINQPQVGILGTGTVVPRPVVVEDTALGEVIAVRSMVYLALTYDHRLVDGADAARYLTTVKSRLEEGAFETELGL